MTTESNPPASAFARALWRVYGRSLPPGPWQSGGNLPWDDPDFSARMLREHLDPSHGAASRAPLERERVLEWLWQRLALQEGARLLDVTCGPGLYAVPLARRGLDVTGVDFAPAAINYARQLAEEQKVADRCHFILQDVRQAAFEAAAFDAALYLYGQWSVLTRQEAQTMLDKIARALRPGGRFCLELLNKEQVDKSESTWWFTDDSGLWGEKPFLHLGERFWNEEEQISIERFFTLDLETAELSQVTLCDQTYEPEEVIAMLRQAGFTEVAVWPAWGGVEVYDEEEWIVYLAHK